MSYHKRYGHVEFTNLVRELLAGNGNEARYNETRDDDGNLIDVQVTISVPSNGRYGTDVVKAAREKLREKYLAMDPPYVPPPGSIRVEPNPDGPKYVQRDDTR